MSKNTTMSRRQRRQDLRRAKFLRIKNMFSFFSPQRQAWYKKVQEDGKAAHEINQKRSMDQIEEQLQIKLNSIKETWADIGYNEAEIALLEEAWVLTSVKDSDHVQRRLDKKESYRLMREARELYAARV